MKYRIFWPVALFLVSACSDKTNTLPPVVIPDIIFGEVIDFNVTPVDITTPDKGAFSVLMNNTIYKVVFDAVDQAQSNATLAFVNDTVLIDQSREYAYLGKDIIAYNPIKENEITLTFTGGRKVSGLFVLNTNFIGTFGETLINQWRDAADLTKPNQKAKDDLRNFIKHYEDADGSGPGTDPIFLSAQVTKN
jgi:hypothetical protein